jgi:hypothetical protein
MASDSPPGSWLSHIFGGGDKSKEADTAANSASHPSSSPPAAADNQPPEEQNKKGVLRRIFGIFGGKKDADKKQSGSSDPQN